MKNQNSNYPWKQEHDEKLRELVHSGFDQGTIATLIGRSPWAVYMRRRKLGLPMGEYPANLGGESYTRTPKNKYSKTIKTTSILWGLIRWETKVK